MYNNLYYQIETNFDDHLSTKIKNVNYISVIDQIIGENLIDKNG